MKKRLDILLTELGLVESRSKAQALIMAGLVLVGDKSNLKAGDLVKEDANITIKGDDHPWVSRGGIKLDHAIKIFGIDVSDKVALDVGSSTGGFTDVLLHYGASKVYAVDVGSNQLDWKLRKDDRVVVLENTNSRILSHDIIPDKPDIIVCDVSFISVTKALPAALDLAGSNCILVTLIKPQFEVGKGEVGKGGIVKDTALHERVCKEVSDWVESKSGWKVAGLVPSPIKGAKGNQEFLLYAKNLSLPI